MLYTYKSCEISVLNYYAFQGTKCDVGLNWISVIELVTITKLWRP